MAKRRYCKNTVPGKQGRGKKYPAAVRAEVVMAMIGSNSICAVARRYGVPESTIRSWMAEEAGKPDGVFAAARVEAAREIAAVRAFRRRYKRAFGRLQWKRAEQKRMTTISAKPMTVAPSSPTSGFSAAKAMAPSSAAQAYTCLTKI